MSDDALFFAEFDTSAPDEAAELRALERALSLAQGFTLLFAVCNLPDQRRRLMDALRQRLPDLATAEVQFSGPVVHLLDELRDRTASPAPDAVFVSGLENCISSDDDPYKKPFIANLNAARNSFPHVVPCPTVLWVPDYVLAAIRQGAPDFFSIRSGTYVFAATPQATQALSQSLTSGEEGAAYSLPLAEKRERIAAICSLLDDYRKLPPAQRDYKAELRLLTRLGNLLDGIGRVREAIAIHQECLQLARAINNRSWEGAALGSLGNAYATLGETRRAIKYMEQVLGIMREIGDRRGEGTALGNLGVAYAALGETQRALEYREQYLAIAREIGDRRGEGIALGNLGVAYADLGETRRAIEYQEQALAIDLEIGERRGEGNALMNLGNAYADLGETRRAIEYHEQALPAFREIGDRRGEGNALGNLAFALDSLGERARAVELAEAALGIYEAIEDPNAAKVRRKLEEWRGES